GNSGENLYTEKGNYNTETGVANFSKNNLYTEGTRFLKGDSLYYDRATGLGKAYRNVVFVDTLDKFYAYGGYGLYNQADESITMTDKPLITMVVENDSTSTPPDSVMVAPTDSVDTEQEIAAPPDERQLEEEHLKEETLPQEESNTTADSELLTATDSTQTAFPRDTANVDSVYMTADTLYSRMIMLRDYQALDLKLNRDGGEIEVYDDVDYGDDEETLPQEESNTTADSELLTATDSTQTAFPRDTANVDSVYMTADTLYSRMIMLRDYQALDLKLNRDGGEIEVYDDVDYGDDEEE